MLDEFKAKARGSCSGAIKLTNTKFLREIADKMSDVVGYKAVGTTVVVFNR
jgi:hypothetical protein